MVDARPYISFDSINVSRVHGFSKYESREAFQENEALCSTSTVMPGPHSFGLYSRVNTFIIIKTLSPRTPHTYSMHGPHLVCYFTLKSLHQFYDSNSRFYDRIEAWLEICYLNRFPMNYHYEISIMVNRVFDFFIFPMSSLLLF